MTILKRFSNPYFWFILLFCILCNQTLLYAADIDNITGRKPVPGSWRVIFTDKEIYKQPSFNDENWHPISLSYKPGEEIPEGARYMWLRCTFIANGPIPGKKIFLLAGKLEGAIEFYFNGVLIGFHGNFPPQYQHHESSTKQSLIPNQLFRMN